MFNIRNEILELQATINKIMEEDTSSNYNQIIEASNKLDRLILQVINNPSLYHSLKAPVSS